MSIISSEPEDAEIDTSEILNYEGWGLNIPAFSLDSAATYVFEVTLSRNLDSSETS